MVEIPRSRPATREVMCVVVSRKARRRGAFGAGMCGDERRRNARKSSFKLRARVGEKKTESALKV